MAPELVQLKSSTSKTRGRDLTQVRNDDQESSCFCWGNSVTKIRQRPLINMTNLFSTWKGYKRIQILEYINSGCWLINYCYNKKKKKKKTIPLSRDKTVDSSSSVFRDMAFVDYHSRPWTEEDVALPMEEILKRHGQWLSSVEVRTHFIFCS